MDFDRLDDLAGDPRFIPGIYNYCDRWCERCTLAHRCLTRAMEMAENYGDGEAAAEDPKREAAPEDRDAENALFWEELQASLDEKSGSLDQEAGITASIFDDPETEARIQRRELRKQALAEAHPVATISRDYMDASAEFLERLDVRIKQRQQELESADVEFESAEQIVDLEDCLEVIGWYHTLIHVKLSRALMSAGDEAEETDPEMMAFPKDSDASAKISLIGIDRSIAAWTRLGNLLGPSPETAAFRIRITQLAQLQAVTEATFPDARAFVRPGFDGPAFE